jgi:anaerobic selenocysteine-containing dehydrogenase
MEKNNDNIKRIPTVCGMCGPEAGCGIYAHVENGRFVGIEGMEESPINKGKLCPKAYGSMQWVYSPQRLKYPLKRIGKRGEGKFAKISWDEAIDIIATKLLEQKEQYGPETLGILSPASRSYSTLLYRFLMAHGSPNYGHSGICFKQRHFAFMYTFGGIRPIPDYDNADLILIWGKQPIYSTASKGGIRTLIEAKRRGTTLISIKPSFEPDTAKSDMWVPIRPGTDAALALGMLHVIINENLYDSAFVEKWCYGFDEFRDHVQQYTTQWAEEITGIPKDQIELVARKYATAGSAAIDMGNGFEHAPSACDAVRAVSILIAITGNLDRKGGNTIAMDSTMPAANSIRLEENHTPELRDKLVGPEFPLVFQPFTEGLAAAYFKILESVLTEDPHRIRTIIAPGTQPLVSTRGTKTVIEALEKVDFFVTIDMMQTAEHNYADIVLPVACSYESDYPFEITSNWITASRKVIEPQGDYKSMQEFWFELAVKMGYSDDFWGGDVDKCMDYQLEPFDISFEELNSLPHGISYPTKAPEYEKYERLFGIKTTTIPSVPFLPQQKVAIKNTTFESAGYSAFPEWVEPPESLTASPHLKEKYPLIFSDYHTSKVFNASWLRNIPILREILPFPTLDINTQTAEERGIKDGDEVLVESAHGSIKLKARVFSGIRPDTVMALHGWWQGCEQLKLPGYDFLDGGANTNNMYATKGEGVYDPLITAMTSQTLVQVSKI